MADPASQKLDWLSHLLRRVMAGPLPVVLLIGALLGGIISLMITPREEEPQFNGLIAGEKFLVPEQ